jgi:YegS/Rv2252/BmrU family lipid kinase
MKRILVIFNPAARGEKSQRLRRFLDSKTRDRVMLAPTQGPGDATDLAAKAASEHCDVVVAAGGDGTINEVVNGLIGTTSALGIIPLGTVNVFAKELGISSRVESAWRTLEAGHTRTIDLGCATSGGQRRYFVQLGGVGFDARAVRAASWKLKKKIGPLAYVWAGLKVMGETHAPIEVVHNGTPPLRGAVVFVGNGRMYGGKYKLFPTARLNNGLLDVCICETFSVLDILRYGQGLLCGRHTTLRGVHYFQTREFSCHSTEPTPFQLDGEDAGDAPVTFSVMPAALRVVVPAGPNTTEGEH